MVINLHHRESTVGVDGFCAHRLTFPSSGNTASCVAAPETEVSVFWRLSFFGQWEVTISDVVPVARPVS